MALHAAVYFATNLNLFSPIPWGTTFKGAVLTFVLGLLANETQTPMPEPTVTLYVRNLAKARSPLQWHKVAVVHMPQTPAIDKDTPPRMKYTRKPH